MKREPFRQFVVSEDDMVIINKLLETDTNIFTLKITKGKVSNELISMPDYKDGFDRTYESFDTLKNQIISENNNICQIWYSLSIRKDLKDKIITILKKYTRENYPEIVGELNCMWEYTMFDKNCFIDRHTDDGDRSRIVGILIYLNKNYDKKNGGLLKVVNTDTNEVVEIIPEFGHGIMIDYTENVVPHEVTKVLKGERRAICAFIHKLNFES